MNKKAAYVLAFALSAVLAFSQDEGGGLIEGDTWAFLVSAPEGWVWDGASLRSQGIQGLFYLKGTSFSPSKLHMYIRPSPKKAGEAPSFTEFVQADEASLMKSSAGALVKDLAPYSTGMDYLFVLRDFDYESGGFYQSIAYYEGEEAYFAFVLFCRSTQERDRERGSFVELLDSFTYIRKE